MRQPQTPISAPAPVRIAAIDRMSVLMQVAHQQMHCACRAGAAVGGGRRRRHALSSPPPAAAASPRLATPAPLITCLPEPVAATQAPPAPALPAKQRQAPQLPAAQQRAPLALAHMRRRRLPSPAALLRRRQPTGRSQTTTLQVLAGLAPWDRLACLACLLAGVAALAGAVLAGAACLLAGWQCTRPVAPLQQCQSARACQPDLCVHLLLPGLLPLRLC